MKKSKGISKEWRFTMMAMLVGIVVMAFSPVANAIPVPVVDSFGYDFYDLAVTNGLKGSIGYVGGLACIVLGGMFLAKQNFLGGVSCILGGGCIIKADKITTSLGALFQ